MAMHTAETENAVLIKMANTLGLQFSYGDMALTLEEVFSSDGALPIFYTKAAIASNSLLASVDPDNKEDVDADAVDIGVALVSDQESLLGFRQMVRSDEQLPTRLMFVLDAIIEIADPALKAGKACDLLPIADQMQQEFQSVLNKTALSPE